MSVYKVIEVIGTSGQSWEDAATTAVKTAGETSEGKASLISVPANVEPIRRALLAVRETIDTYHTPRVQESVAGVLETQRSEIARLIRAHADHLAAKPGDTSVWWDEARWNEQLTRALRAPLVSMADSVSRQVHDVLPPAKPQ